MIEFTYLAYLLTYSVFDVMV